LQSAEIMIMSSRDEPETADRTIRHGASYFFCKPFDPKTLGALVDDLAQDLVPAQSGAPDQDGIDHVDQFGFLRGSSPPMRQLYRLLRKVGPQEATVMLVGESGTGKELAARTLHELSPRSDGPFIAFNCSSLNENLIESELFGHEKGSFSGAGRRHLGFFERAAGGTLMLDEITEMSPDLQTQLLRVLEERRMRRVGAEKDTALDVRVISATNRIPEKAVAEGALREDLYFRLAQFPIYLPPLRERRNDIRGLAQYFLTQLNNLHTTRVRLSEEALAALESQAWPGNVRQLKHAIERAYIVADTEIGPRHLATTEVVPEQIPEAPETIRLPLGDTLAESERKIIEATLNHYGGDKKLTASRLGISLKTLYNRLNEYSSDEDPPAPEPDREWHAH
jgi:DNA-binding NtrC family response regulator